MSFDDFSKLVSLISANLARGFVLLMGRQYHPRLSAEVLIGRYYNDYGKAIDRHHWLTQSIIATRSSDWTKTADGVEFTALKRPVIRYKGYLLIGQEVYQTWRFNMDTKEFTFVSELFGEEVCL